MKIIKKGKIGRKQENRFLVDVLPNFIEFDGLYKETNFASYILLPFKQEALFACFTYLECGGVPKLYFISFFNRKIIRQRIIS